MSKPLAYSKLKISVIYNTVLLKGVWLAKDGVETRMLETRVSKNYAEILVIWSGPGLLLVTYKMWLNVWEVVRQIPAPDFSHLFAIKMYRSLKRLKMDEK